MAAQGTRLAVKSLSEPCLAAVRVGVVDLQLVLRVDGRGVLRRHARVLRCELQLLLRALRLRLRKVRGWRQFSSQ